MRAEFLQRVEVLNLYLERGETEQLESLNELFDFDSHSGFTTLMHGANGNAFTLRTFRGVKMKRVFRNPWASGPPLKAADIEGFQAINCLGCGYQLVHGDSIRRILDLPSNHWMELVDCWSCHQSEFAVVTNKVTMGTSSESGGVNHQLILPPPGSLFVALDKLVLHKDNVCGGENCPACGTFLGHAIDLNHFGLMKHAVRFVGEREFPQCSPLPMLLLHLHELFLHNGSTRFYFAENGLVLEVLNWNVVIFDASNQAKSAVKLSWRKEPSEDCAMNELESLHFDPVTKVALLEALNADVFSTDDGSSRIVLLSL